MIYTFRSFYIPEGIMEEIRLYVEDGVKPGSFLSAIIQNDLSDACGRADDKNLHNLPAFVAYFWGETPACCWGSSEHMERWMKKKKEERKR